LYMWYAPICFMILKINFPDNAIVRVGANVI